MIRSLCDFRVAFGKIIMDEPLLSYGVLPVDFDMEKGFIEIIIGRDKQYVKYVQGNEVGAIYSVLERSL